jgi:two-component system response regulator
LPGAPQHFTSKSRFWVSKTVALKFFVTFPPWPDLIDVERIHIAIAEDDPGDRMWLKMILDKLGINYRLTIAEDGEHARDFILKNGQYATFPPAHLIFLDMNMPKMSGLEVLRTIPDSAELPVCIVTSSQRERQSIEQHFAPRKVSYLTKPVDPEQLLGCLRRHAHLRPFVEQIVKH